LGTTREIPPFGGLSVEETAEALEGCQGRSGTPLKRGMPLTGRDRPEGSTYRGQAGLAFTQSAQLLVTLPQVTEVEVWEHVPLEVKHERNHG
jgi:hypothetical protein